MFRNVCYRRLAFGWLKRVNEALTFPSRESLFLLFGVLVLVAACSPAARAGGITILPEVRQGMDLIYGGDPDAAIPIARSLQQSQPDHPAGFLLEGEALWWKRFCAACEIKYGMFEAWKRSKEPEDDAYIALADKEISGCGSSFGQNGNCRSACPTRAWVTLRARVYGLRGAESNVARVAVKRPRRDAARSRTRSANGGRHRHSRRLQLLLDTLSVHRESPPRFSWAFPGASKDEGIRQLEVGMIKAFSWP